MIYAESSSYTIPPEQRGYYELSTAIVRTAVSDYRRAKRATLIRDDKCARCSLMDLRTFFLSDLFEVLTGIDYAYDFLDSLDKQVEEEVEKGIRRKRFKRTNCIE